MAAALYAVVANSKASLAGAGEGCFGFLENKFCIGLLEKWFRGKKETALQFKV
ncbi:hypothetical protein MTHERMOG20_13740 [Moorella thermoacetica]|uniref:Uncharacterized protein n=1 Tax=Neomoorella thermoacetica TaxID=1525 RepID=A0A1D7X6F4_NEOTH|nr:hypothetical protein MOTHE_c00090 [Moorella thermoacetica]AKX95393.1 hypothetical protein MOTHA_c00090 [Moorella thermoacetica]AOQ22510.1 hypothetical protein Maut_00009 [Moorella thermoacetica]OIQ10195.1 hypothetical protein MOOR_02690 [Moorella thermoacetica]OIQ11320.1 hypothetical protein MOOTH_17180 [Moorella thermoacetica]